MTEAEFRTARRQKFLTEKYFQLNRNMELDNIASKQQAIAENRIAPSDTAFAAIRGGAFKSALKVLRLHYTAGEPIESLRPMYAEATRWFAEWHRAYVAQVVALAQESGEDLRTDGSPSHFEDLFHFQLVVDVVSLGILFGDAASVRETAAWIERYRGTDMLVEYLLEKVVADPRDIEEFFHEAPYGLLLDAVYTADTQEESQAFMQQYLDNWYKSFEGVPWHNGHLVVTDEYSNYEGYWAFEAAAVCVLLGLDDTPFRDHMVYPKDLADWARAHKVTASLASPAGAQVLRLRCEAGEVCPQTGYWSTPAKADSRRRFQQGETMPELGAAYGATIWQWDSVQ